MAPGRRSEQPARSRLPAWLQALAGLAAVAAVVVGGRYLVTPAFRFIAAARLREIFTASALLLVIAVAVADGAGRPVAGARRLPGRGGAGRERVPPRAGDRHRAVPRPAARPVLHHRGREPRPPRGRLAARCCLAGAVVGADGPEERGHVPAAARLVPHGPARRRRRGRVAGAGRRVRLRPARLDRRGPGDAAPSCRGLPHRRGRRVDGRSRPLATRRLRPALVLETRRKRRTRQGQARDRSRSTRAIRT